jgi:hypothetical protein
MITKHTIDSAFDSIAVTQSTSPWVIGDGGGSITVDAVSLDIRPLTSADQVTIANASIPVTDNGGSLTVDGTVELGATTLAALENITVDAITAAVTIQDGGNVISIDDAGGSITVDGTVGISGTVAVTQSTSPWVVSGSVATTPEAYDVWQTTSDVAVTSSAGGTQIASSPLTGRLKIKVQNVGGNDIRLAESTGAVSSTRGVFLKRGTSEEIELGAGAQLWALGVGGASTLTVTEYAA